MLNETFSVDFQTLWEIVLTNTLSTVILSLAKSKDMRWQSPKRFSHPSFYTTGLIMPPKMELPSDNKASYQ